MKFCCEMMRNNTDVLEHDIKRSVEHILSYNPYYDEYLINYFDGGFSGIEINFCPWCAQELPQTKRLIWFDVLEELGYDDPWDQEIPEDFKSNAWYLNQKYDDIISEKSKLRNLTQSEKINRFLEWTKDNFPFTIPDEYFSFLNDEKTDRFEFSIFNYKVLVGQNCIERVLKIFSFFELYPHKYDNRDLLKNYISSKNEEYSSHFLPICCDCKDRVILINCLAGLDYGKIYLCDPKMANCFIISNSMTEFFDSLYKV
jgi:hypothetical protein